MSTDQLEREMKESLERARLKVEAEKEEEQERLRRQRNNNVPPPGWHMRTGPELVERVDALKPPPEPPLSLPTFVAKANDPVSHPAHYTAGRIECIDAIESAIAGLTGIEAFDTGQALKYLWRWKRKNGVEDLEKARWYLDHLLRRLKPGAPTGNGNPA